jgi:transglutaminase-like putative cysteine protease
MLIRVGHKIVFSFFEPSAMLLMLHLHPSRAASIREPECLSVVPAGSIRDYFDIYGNRCSRVTVPAGLIRVKNHAIVEDDGVPELQEWNARQHDIQDLPDDALLFLLASRYCEVDSDLKAFAWSQFGQFLTGWLRVQAVCNFCHQHIRFDYLQARADRTAREVFRERAGVCRDFMHLAITLCRCLNIPARYCTGYLGDIGVPASAAPMDFSAWFEAFVGGKWYPFDARNNLPRIGRVLMARGRDAADVAMTTTFGRNQLQSFHVWTDEVA